jgi:carbamoyltransferase
MPFAPSILSERLDDYCTHSGKACYQFMTVAAESTDVAKKEIIAGLHPYDLTARPQEVTASACPDYHGLLSRFQDKTGVGGVLNTSLNIHGKPIVRKPVKIADELLSVPEVALDYLVVGDSFYTHTKTA